MRPYTRPYTITATHPDRGSATFEYTARNRAEARQFFADQYARAGWQIKRIDSLRRALAMIGLPIAGVLALAVGYLLMQPPTQPTNAAPETTQPLK